MAVGLGFLRSRREQRLEKVFAERPGEGAYERVTRVTRSVGFRDLPKLLLHRRNSDRAQVEAIQLYAQLKMVKWTRALAFGTVILGGCTIVAALIASS